MVRYSQQIKKLFQVFSLFTKLNKTYKKDKLFLRRT